MSTKPNPLGMTRRAVPGAHPPHRYEIFDGEQLAGETEHIALSRQQSGRAHPAVGQCLWAQDLASGIGNPFKSRLG
jgi:hypothetical protein